VPDRHGVDMATSLLEQSMPNTTIPIANLIQAGSGEVDVQSLVADTFNTIRHNTNTLPSDGNRPPGDTQLAFDQMESNRMGASIGRVLARLTVKPILESLLLNPDEEYAKQNEYRQGRLDLIFPG